MASSTSTREHSAHSSSYIDQPQSQAAVRGKRGVKVVKTCTIRKPARELYAFWRSLENLTAVIKHPVRITRISETESHWSVTGPGGHQVDWDAVIINDEPDRLLAWRSQPGADVANAGTVRFQSAPGDEGTEVKVQLEYDPPGGKLAALLAKVTGEEPAQQVSEMLRRFKALMEAGEIPTTEGQSSGRKPAEKLSQGKS
jgi:uncharacterized membrane protein